MRWMLTFVGILIVLGGLLPLIRDILPDYLGFLPTEGMSYQILIIVIGVIAVIYGIKTKKL